MAEHLPKAIAEQAALQAASLVRDLLARRSAEAEEEEDSTERGRSEGRPLDPPETDRAAAALEEVPARCRPLLAGLLTNARVIRLRGETALSLGMGDQTHPVFEAYAKAARGVAESYGASAAFPAPDDDFSRLDRRRWAGRRALGQAAALAKVAGRLDHAALAIAAVFDEVGIDGRVTVTAALEQARKEHGWPSAVPVHRAVIDALALSRMLDAVVQSFRAVAIPAQARADSGADEWSLFEESVEEALRKVDHLISGEGAGTAAKDTAEAIRKTPSSRGTGEVKWASRSRTSRRRLASAERLVRHLHKAGLTSTASASLGGSAARPPALGDPIATLALPAPLELLQGEAAAAAAATRDQIAAMRVAWPPPERVRRSGLLRLNPDGSLDHLLWDPFLYGCADGQADDAVDPWMDYLGGHETPGEMEAGLAEWAPDYVADRVDGLYRPVVVAPLSTGEDRCSGVTFGFPV